MELGNQNLINHKYNINIAQYLKYKIIILPKYYYLKIIFNKKIL